MIHWSSTLLPPPGRSFWRLAMFLLVDLLMASLQKAAWFICMGESVLKVRASRVCCCIKISLSAVIAITGPLDDLLMFNPKTSKWTNITAVGSGQTSPSPRSYHGFTSAGGKLYVHGGSGRNGKEAVAMSCCWGVVHTEINYYLFV